ncbi:MAG: hypothetical protein NZO16_01940 [Deltaproteobacteria bacterium]|nr:hypothetical protein [Deltaproteobacteria bacterium]
MKVLSLLASIIVVFLPFSLLGKPYGSRMDETPHEQIGDVVFADGSVIYKCDSSKEYYCSKILSLQRALSLSLCDVSWAAGLERDDFFFLNIHTGEKFIEKTPLGVNFSYQHCDRVGNKLILYIGNINGFVHVSVFDPSVRKIQTSILQLSKSAIKYIGSLENDNLITCSGEKEWDLANLTKALPVFASESLTVFSQVPAKRFNFESLKNIAQCSYNGGYVCGIDSDGNYECWKLRGVKLKISGKTEKSFQAIFNRKSNVFIQYPGYFVDVEKQIEINGRLVFGISQQGSYLLRLIDGKLKSF